MMQRLPIEWLVALKFLREGRSQTVLILTGVTVGAAVIIYISAIITGLQDNIIRRTLGTQAHVVARTAEERVQETVSADTLAGDTRKLAVTQKRAQRLRGISEWQKIYAHVAAMPEVTAVSAMVSGAGFAVRGDANKAIAIIAVEADEYAKIINFSDKMVAGRFVLGSEQAVIGTELANDLGIGVGDRVRVITALNRSQVFTVSGVFDLGIKDINRRWVVMPLRAGQTLLDLPGGVTHIEMRVQDIFAATQTAEAIGTRFDVIAESWMQTNSQLMIGLRSQSASSWVIRGFVTLSVAFGIASVLVVSVVQKSREIGILRAMGMSSRSIHVIFLIQGGIFGLVGAVLGMSLGTLLAILFTKLATQADGSPLFEITLSANLYVSAAITATLTGLIAAAAPARRAAKLDPVVAIRHV